MTRSDFHPILRTTSTQPSLENNRGAICVSSTAPSWYLENYRLRQPRNLSMKIDPPPYPSRIIETTVDDKYCQRKRNNWVNVYMYIYVCIRVKVSHFTFCFLTIEILKSLKNCMNGFNSAVAYRNIKMLKGKIRQIVLLKKTLLPEHYDNLCSHAIRHLGLVPLK